MLHHVERLRTHRDWGINSHAVVSTPGGDGSRLGAEHGDVP